MLRAGSNVLVVCIQPGGWGFPNPTLNSHLHISSLTPSKFPLIFHQVRLTDELASSTARVSQQQLEVSAHHQKALELQSKLSSVLHDSESHCQQVTALETQLDGLC